MGFGKADIAAFVKSRAKDVKVSDMKDMADVLAGKRTLSKTNEIGNNSIENEER